MTAYPAWTPASRPGIVPLHPLSFGTILGRSFVALRQNPKVLLGFALGVQLIAYLIVLAAVGATTFAMFSRLDTLRPGSEEYDLVMAGSVAAVIVVSVLAGLAAGAVSILVQGVVVVEVTHAVVAEKPTLREVWQRVRPVAWRLIGYTALLSLVLVAVAAVLTAAMLALAAVAVPVAILLTVLLVLGSIPVLLFFTIKLLLVPSAIIMERATLRGAVVRSWTLTRGRFWPALGIIVIISLSFAVLGQVISIPFSLLSSGLTVIVAPTGAADPSAMIGMVVTVLLMYALLFVIQSVAIVVQSTATALIYVDARMRREGLDLDLMEYVDQRDAGRTDLPDPYTAHVGRDLSGRFAPPPVPYGYAPPPGYGPPPPGYAPPTGYASPPGPPAP